MLILLLLVLMHMSACSTSSRTGKLDKEKPNIIFILADDLGYGDAGFNGQTKINTPVLDQMAA